MEIEQAFDQMKTLHRYFNMLTKYPERSGLGTMMLLVC